MSKNRSPVTLALVHMGSSGNDGLMLSPSAASAQKFEIKPVAEKKVQQSPPGPLFWRIDNFPTLAQAQAAAGPTGLAAEVAGKVWLFTLGSKGGSSPDGNKVAEIGPIAPVTAPEYLLRINNTGDSRGSNAGAYASRLRNFLCPEWTAEPEEPHGVSHVDAGQSMPGHGPDMPMEVSSSGTSDLNALVMFVVDATKPFSSPATMP